MADEPVQPAVWRPGAPAGRSLRALTAARIGLGRAGNAICTDAQLEFQLDHAAARDAVHTQLNGAALLEQLRASGWPALPLLRSACGEERGTSRRLYLQRPDLGRRLSLDSAARLREAAALDEAKPEAVIAVVDGLSALAVERHALPLLDALRALPRSRPSLGPVCVVRDGRVAIGDEIGEIVGAAIAVVLIGERPGLSAPDSLGVYVTWAPRPGRTDAERHCISNIRHGGLSYNEAGQRLGAMLEKARELRGTGVGFGFGFNAALGPGA